MKKAWKFLLSVILGIIIMGFIVYILIPALSGIIVFMGVIIAVVIVIRVAKNYFEK